ncbi:MAG: phosphoribosyl-AMP cyclohydrolase [Isosphaeraceae bacterium]
MNVPESTASSPDPDWFEQVKWTAEGLVPAIAQDAGSGEVLMMAWMDRQALRTTLASGQTHFYSRSRRSAWHKGGTSGHVQNVVEVRVDCDADVILLKVEQVGGACHEGYRSCFFRKVASDGRLQIEGEPVFRAEDVYGPKRDPGSVRGHGPGRLA